MQDLPNLSQADCDQLLANNEPLRDVLVEGLEFDPDALQELEAFNVRFVGCRWIDMDFTGARFKDCQFSACSFTRSNLGEVEFSRCTFFDKDAGEGTDFSYAEMREVKFENCNLSSSTVNGADLFDATIKECKANGFNLEDATFTRTYGRSQRVTRAALVSTIFDDANLSGLDLEGCNLSRSSFVRADLSGSIFMNADMAECDLSAASLRKANFERADLRGAQLEGFSLGLLSGYEGVKISEDQQAILLEHLGVQVFP